MALPKGGARPVILGQPKESGSEDGRHEGDNDENRNRVPKFIENRSCSLCSVLRSADSEHREAPARHWHPFMRVYVRRYFR